MNARKASIKRVTEETRMTVKLTLNGQGQASVKTGVPFFDHMLTLFAKHGVLDLKLGCQGDPEVDAHHTVEDCGIALGQAFAQALGEKGKERKGSERGPFLVLASLGRGSALRSSAPVLGVENRGAICRVVSRGKRVGQAFADGPAAGSAWVAGCGRQRARSATRHAVPLRRPNRQRRTLCLMGGKAVEWRNRRIPACLQAGVPTECSRCARAPGRFDFGL